MPASRFRCVYLAISQESSACMLQSAAQSGGLSSVGEGMQKLMWENSVFKDSLCFGAKHTE